MLHRAVSRLAGPVAGLVAALVLAVSPATVALDRENISDSLLWGIASRRRQSRGDPLRACFVLWGVPARRAAA